MPLPLSKPTAAKSKAEKNQHAEQPKAQKKQHPEQLPAKKKQHPEQPLQAMKAPSEAKPALKQGKEHKFQRAHDADDGDCVMLTDAAAATAESKKSMPKARIAHMKNRPHAQIMSSCICGCLFTVLTILVSQACREDCRNAVGKGHFCGAVRRDPSCHAVRVLCRNLSCLTWEVPNHVAPQAQVGSTPQTPNTLEHTTDYLSSDSLADTMETQPMEMPPGASSCNSDSNLVGHCYLHDLLVGIGALARLFRGWTSSP